MARRRSILETPCISGEGFSTQLLNEISSPRRIHVVGERVRMCVARCVHIMVNEASAYARTDLL